MPKSAHINLEDVDGNVCMRVVFAGSESFDKDSPAHQLASIGMQFLDRLLVKREEPELVLSGEGIPIIEVPVEKEVIELLPVVDAGN